MVYRVFIMSEYFRIRSSLETSLTYIRVRLLPRFISKKEAKQKKEKKDGKPPTLDLSFQHVG